MILSAYFTICPEPLSIAIIIIKKKRQQKNKKQKVLLTPVWKDVIIALKRALRTQ